MPEPKKKEADDSAEYFEALEKLIVAIVQKDIYHEGITQNKETIRVCEQKMRNFLRKTNA